MIQFGTLTDELEAAACWLAVTPKFSSPSGSSLSEETAPSSRCSIERSVIRFKFLISLPRQSMECHTIPKFVALKTLGLSYAGMYGFMSKTGVPENVKQQSMNMPNIQRTNNRHPTVNHIRSIEVDKSIVNSINFHQG